MKKGKFALGTLVGAAAAGLATGILTAPKSGKETRADIKNKAGEVKDKAVAEVTVLSEKADKMATEAKANVKEIVKEVETKATDLKERADYAVKGAKKGFFEKK